MAVIKNNELKNMKYGKTIKATLIDSQEGYGVKVRGKFVSMDRHKLNIIGYEIDGNEEIRPITLKLQDETILTVEDSAVFGVKRLKINSLLKKLKKK